MAQELKEATTDFEPKAHEDAELTREQVAELFQKLLDERDRVVKGINKHVSEVLKEDDQLADELDQSVRHAEQAYLLRFADKERKLLGEIDHAMEKLKFGEYGICEGTGEAIGWRRLELRPWTRYSVAFKEQMERWRQ